MQPVALNVGFYNYVIIDKVIALVSSDSAPMSVTTFIPSRRADSRVATTF